MSLKRVNEYGVEYEGGFMLSIVCLLWFSAFIGTILSALGKVPLWVPLLLACIAGLLTCLPLR